MWLRGSIQSQVYPTIHHMQLQSICGGSVRTPPTTDHLIWRIYLEKNMILLMLTVSHMWYHSYQWFWEKHSVASLLGMFCFTQTYLTWLKLTVTLTSRLVIFVFRCSEFPRAQGDVFKCLCPTSSPEKHSKCSLKMTAIVIKIVADKFLLITLKLQQIIVDYRRSYTKWKHVLSVCSHLKFTHAV